MRFTEGFADGFSVLGLVGFAEGRFDVGFNEGLVVGFREGGVVRRLVGE